MQYRDILYRVEDPVAIITMNRPERLNAFTRTMLAEIRHAVAAAEAEDAAKRDEWTFGVSYWPVPSVVVKADYQLRDDESAEGLPERFNMGLGWSF